MSITSVKSLARATATRRAIYIAFSTAALSLLGAGAHATEVRSAQKAVNIKFEDLDLSQRSGAQALYSRLQGAAKRVCVTFDRKDLERAQMEQDCYEKALGDAVATVDRSTVTALHRMDKSIRFAQETTRTRSPG